MPAFTRRPPDAPLPTPPWSPAAERAAVIGFWSFLAALELLRRTRDPFRPPDDIGLVAYVGLASYVVWVLITPLVFRFVRLRPLQPGALGRRVAVHLGAALGVSVAVELLHFTLVGVVLRSGAAGAGGLPPFLQALGPADVILRLWFLDELVVYLGILAVGFARGYLIRLRARDRDAARLQAEAARLEAQLADARLAALRMQLNPHFLFNTLHTVSALADDDAEGVQRIVARLSKLLRRTLEGTARQEVPLAEELGFLRDYLDIQRVRFGGRLEVDEDVDGAVLDALVPNLILQPLVENAVKYGAEGSDGAARLAIRAHLDADGARLVLSVLDAGPGLAPGAEARAAEAGRVGLANTRARLAALYGDAADLDLANEPAGGLRASIRLPYHTAADLRVAAPA